ncbi:MAG: 5-carboxyvanillate decarboxylase [Solirubrobacteraceae bacterium]
MRIDTETHYWTPGFLDYLGGRSTAPRLDVLDDGSLRMDSNVSHEFIAVVPRAVRDLQLDLGEGRIRRMDDNGIDVALLSLTTPSVEQLEPEASLAQARAVNDALAEVLRRWPDRFVGMACVAASKPEESAEEIERCATELGFKAVNIMGHVADDEHPYLDHPKYRPLFAAAARLGLPVNLHPMVPHAGLIGPYLGYGWALPTTGLGFGAETALHAVRLILSGLFDEHPDLKMTLGHFGEALSFWTFRLDLGFRSSRIAVKGGERCEHPPSHYLRNNFWFNSSGNFLNSALIGCLFEFGADRLMFASDYPWEPLEEAAAFMDAAPLSPADREKVEWRNAVELFSLDVSACNSPKCV